MGIFSSIGNLLGIGESSTKYARKAGDADIAQITEGLEYLKGVLDPQVARSEEAASLGYGFYSGDPAAQKQVYESAQNSPYYESLIDTGRQGVGASLSATGGLRGGSGPSSFYAQDQKVLQGLVNQNLAGIDRYSAPVDVSAVPQLYNALGDANAAKYQAVGQAKQDKYGNMLDLGKTLLGFI